VLRGVHNRELTSDAGSFHFMHQETRSSLVLSFWATFLAQGIGHDIAVLRAESLQCSCRLSYRRLTENPALTIVSSNRKISNARDIGC